MDSKLRSAFRWHLQNMPRHRHGFGEGLADAPRAVFALAMARRDLAAGIARYPAPVKPFPAFGAADESGYRWSEKPEAAGLRLVGRVEADCGGRNGIWDKRESSGWYADEDMGNLCYGLVYQLPGRNGESRFVAGYAFSEDEGATLDLRRIYAEPAAWFEPARKSASGYTLGGYWNYQDNPCKMDAARDAAYSADSMAKAAAEAEREYQTAWQAGAEWADLGEDIANDRRKLLDMLAERRTVKGSADYPALCKALLREVSRLLDNIQNMRERRQGLRAGDASGLEFWPGDAQLAAAFNDGAGESVLPC